MFRDQGKTFDKSPQNLAYQIAHALYLAIIDAAKKGQFEIPLDVYAAKRGYRFIVIEAQSAAGVNQVARDTLSILARMKTNITKDVGHLAVEISDIQRINRLEYILVRVRVSSWDRSLDLDY